jgi:hypothetical protein
MARSALFNASPGANAAHYEHRRDGGGDRTQCAYQKLDFVELWVGDGLLKDACGSIRQEGARNI